MKIAILDNLRSVHNVGSIFRTANAAGIEKLILCGTTPTPLDNKGNKRKDFAKVALGAEETVIWEYVEETKNALELLKQEGFYIVAFEQDEKSVDYKKVSVESKENLAIVIGPEVTGITQEVLALCDVIAEIPMLGTKESLNVTIAFGIGIYRILGL
jgi:tRNA G18 (ribose-2'-O)-methylase SpoU